MDFKLDRIRKNVHAATTEDLLDRITVFRGGMEPAAIEVIEAELDRRGVGEKEIREHADRRSDVLRSGSVAQRCSFCDRPAVARGWGWHRLWGTLPILPRLFYYCEVHRR